MPVQTFLNEDRTSRIDRNQRERQQRRRRQQKRAVRMPRGRETESHSRQRIQIVSAQDVKTDYPSDHDHGAHLGVPDLHDDRQTGQGGECCLAKEYIACG